MSSGSPTKERDPDIGRAQAEKKALALMGSLPAWRNHPDYLARTNKS